MKKLLTDRIRAFGFAFNGITSGIRRETPLKIHFAALVILIPVTVGLKADPSECLMLFCCAGMVIAAEIFNTALEKVCDLVSPGHDNRIKYIKDLSAGGVLITVLLAVAVGTVVIVRHWM